MMCPRCNKLMLLSKAIYPKNNWEGRALSIVPIDHVLKADEVVLIECFKCPKCGFSDATRKQIENGKRLMDDRHESEREVNSELGLSRIGSDNWK